MAERRFALINTKRVSSKLNTQSGNYTLRLSDEGKTIRKATGGSGETITIPANTAVQFKKGSMIGIQNDGGGTLTIAIDSDTLISSADGATGSRTLASWGAAVLLKVTSTTWKISGDQMT